MSDGILGVFIVMAISLTSILVIIFGVSTGSDMREIKSKIELLSNDIKEIKQK